MEDVKNIKVPNIDRIQSCIYEVRGVKVMLDRDLAVIYNTTTANLKRQVRRNACRFPNDFVLELTKEEEESLRSQNGILKGGRGKHSKYLPYAFTELGVAMLSSVLTSEVAALANINIMRAFVAMRKQLSQSAISDVRIEKIEHQISSFNSYIEEILRDQNDTNADVQAQLYAISQSLSDLQMKIEPHCQERTVIKGFSQ